MLVTSIELNLENHLKEKCSFIFIQNEELSIIKINIHGILFRKGNFICIALENKRVCHETYCLCDNFNRKQVQLYFFSGVYMLYKICQFI